MIKLNTNVDFGGMTYKVVGITITLGERYYFLINKYKVVSLVPASTLEAN